MASGSVTSSCWPHSIANRCPAAKVTGDLTGLSRLRFDLPGQHPLRFRIVYRVFDDDTGDLPVIEVLAIGERADHIVYRDTLARLDPTGEDTGEKPRPD